MTKQAFLDTWAVAQCLDVEEAGDLLIDLEALVKAAQEAQRASDAERFRVVSDGDCGPNAHHIILNAPLAGLE